MKLLVCVWRLCFSECPFRAASIFCTIRWMFVRCHQQRTSHASHLLSQLETNKVYRNERMWIDFIMLQLCIWNYNNIYKGLLVILILCNRRSRQLIVRFSPRRREVDPRTVHVGYAVEIVTMGQAYLQVLDSLSVILSMFHTHLPLMNLEKHGLV